MAGAVKTVAAYAVFFVPLDRQRIHVGMFRHGLVKRGVENGNMRHVRQVGQAGFDPGNVRRIVQRRQVLYFLDGVEDLIVDHHRAGEFFAAVHDPVPDSGDVIHAVNDAGLFFNQGLQDQVDGDLMVRAFILFSVGFPAGDFVNDKRIADRDSFNHPLGDNFLFLPVVKLVLDGRTSTIQCKNIH